MLLRAASALRSLCRSGCSGGVAVAAAAGARARTGYQAIQRGYVKLPPKPTQGATSARDRAAATDDRAAHNVTTDVLLFSYSKPRLFAAMKCFGAVALAACVYMAETCYSTLRDLGKASERRSKSQASVLPSAIPENLRWWEKINLGQDIIRTGLAVILVGAGSFVAFYCSILLPSRTVRALVLLRGGQSLGISTYASFGSGKYIVAPRLEVVLQRSRDPNDFARPSAPDLPLKVRGRRFHYMLNSRGRFHNGQLFDHLFSTRLHWS